ncbi:NADPH:quinone reductase-like Zn-dependent oxidoreductase [Tamaricihabitans halophyticus]|uniref:NADPH:quinone reductase-like Zn-dependent oxidoreductase n=1 Tax=Tamaricihabitans halophyticus TaxID=1262583 RepID=A0A4R2R0Y5_9PSEU|nr:zinc-binding dehydrogenase [Tamaricihabitans halophyticus]TCP56143.1 NADPH:quinone reductase-like Zn-dependent oxidoreductase [Tamaricihabitans halophyticus]
MRALICGGNPATWRLTEVPEPAFGPADVLVDVVAAGLNRADLLMRTGGYLPTSDDWDVPVNRVGFEMAGRVRAAGPEVVALRPGDRVMAQTGGACADVVAVDHRLTLPVPEHLSWPQAAGLPSALLTEFDALRNVATLAPNENVLITGASSGVGLVGIQLARVFGASSIVGTTRSTAKASLLRSLGATAVLDTRTRTCAPAEAMDVVLDHVGGPGLAELLRYTAYRARIVQIGRLAGEQATIDLELLAAKRLQLLGTTFRGRQAQELHELVARIRQDLPMLTAEHGVRAVVESTFDITEAEQAAARLAAPDLAGKVVLRLTGQ